jgi:tRNA(Ile)-lysidine synthetase-like protein
MRKLSSKAWRSLFFKHLWRFLRNVASSYELEGSHCIAVSGGLDSMALLWVANFLHQQGKIGPVRALFIHHNTRKGQRDDGRLVEQFCRENEIPYKVIHLEGLDKVESNFEARARRMRREACVGDLKRRELLWAGHHLDDSYEWNFMQRHRSTNPKSGLGIPVRNKALIRPFNCVTRSQLETLVRNEHIPYRQDPTNEDVRFDRNFIRHTIIPKIKQRYPKFLKFYSHHANFSAMIQKTSILARSGAAEIFVFDQGSVMIGPHYSEIQIQEIIHHFSETDRGEIITPIERMLKAIENSKKGPFYFSGAMMAYHSFDLLMVYSQGMTNYDKSVANLLRVFPQEQLENMPAYKRIELQQSWSNLLKTSDAMLNMPGLVLVLERESICKTLNTSKFDPLWPEVSKVCAERGLRFITYTKCLEMWKTKKEKLPETLRLLPLCNLSNLFSSQQ